ncbi:hypothetical protein LJC15_00965 [Desulfovibrio sp. OttesenSCG-928-G11]|nr:hypothetical protein [Desulfovibrio sp. OttesenSCG-928-G11]
MQHFLRFAACAVFAAALAIGGLCAVPQTASADLSGVSAVSCPVLTLKHWQASTEKEKMAFLLGLASFLELERWWQHDQPLPVSRSITQSWVKGLAGTTLGQMATALDAYVEKHPDRLDEPVLKVLGRMYVRAALSPAEKKEAGDRYEQIRRSR